jgi:asparagine synthetase A
MKYYYIMSGQGNDVVAPDKHDLELFKSGVMTAKGFALNYEMKLRSQEAYEWMSRVSAEAIHQDIVLVGEEDGLEKSYRIMLAEMMASMLSGQMNFRYMGELR